MKVFSFICMILLTACQTVSEVRQQIPQHGVKNTVGVGDDIYRYEYEPAYVNDAFYGKKRPVGGFGTGELSDSELGWKQVLVYSGMSNGELKLNYSQAGSIGPMNAEAQYTYSPGETLSYKGAQITVIEANNRQITYIVNSGFSNEVK